MCSSSKKKTDTKIEVSSEDSDSCIEHMLLNSIEMEGKKKELHSVKKTEPDRWTATIKVNDFKINFKLDSGADINVQPNKIYKKTLSMAGIKENSSHTLCP